jgi:membrane-bound lytic murein transglycosylase D
MVFVPKLLALAELVANPERYGMTLPELSTATPFKTVPTGGQVQIVSMADALSVDEDTLYLLNPALNRAATPPEGPHQINVPIALADQARSWIASLDRQQRMEWDRVQVARGDTLGGLARRYGTDVRTLRELNNLPDDRLRAGEHLFIPVPAAGALSGSAGQRAAGGPPVAGAPSPGRSADTRQANRGKVHTVRAGDTLWQIARTYRTTVDRLAAANQLRPGQVLKIGQRLTIPAR